MKAHEYIDEHAYVDDDGLLRWRFNGQFVPFFFALYSDAEVQAFDDSRKHT